jgi:hypothetical protein
MEEWLGFTLGASLATAGLRLLSGLRRPLFVRAKPPRAPAPEGTADTPGVMVLRWPSNPWRRAGMPLHRASLRLVTAEILAVRLSDADRTAILQQASEERGLRH